MEKEKLIKEFQEQFDQSLVFVLDGKSASVSINCCARFAGDMIKDLIKETPEIGKAISASIIRDMTEKMLEVDSLSQRQEVIKLLEELKQAIDGNESQTIN